jgi:YggT family protein
VSSTNPFFVYWWFHVPNLILATLMYTALGRFVLSFIFDAESKNYIWRFFVRLTDPVIRVVGYVTPAAVPPLVVLLFTAVWLFAVRMALLIATGLVGAVPTLGPA